jgi:hypothetical protein
LVKLKDKGGNLLNIVWQGLQYGDQLVIIFAGEVLDYAVVVLLNNLANKVIGRVLLKQVVSHNCFLQII